MRTALLALVAACSFQPGRAPQATDDALQVDVAVNDAPGDSTTTADAHPDAPATTCTQGTCIAAGGSCNGSTCEIVAQNGQTVDCPPTSGCSVSCPNDNQSCRVGMTCGALGDCEFHCTADHSCDAASTLKCDSGSTCEVFCVGDHACKDLTIDCRPGATCIYHCCGPSACTGIFACNGTGCMIGSPTCT